MVSSLPRADIERYYKAVTLPGVSFGQWDEAYDSATITEIELEFDEVKSKESEYYFTLTLFDVGLDVTLDIRCH